MSARLARALCACTQGRRQLTHSIQSGNYRDARRRRTSRHRPPLSIELESSTTMTVSYLRSISSAFSYVSRRIGCRRYVSRSCSRVRVRRGAFGPRRPPVAALLAWAGTATLCAVVRKSTLLRDTATNAPGGASCVAIAADGEDDEGPLKLTGR